MSQVTAIESVWTDDAARKLCELYEAELREVVRKRAVDLGISMDTGDEATAFETLKENRRLRLTPSRYDYVMNSYQPLIDGLVRKITELRMLHTTQQIIMEKPCP